MKSTRIGVLTAAVLILAAGSAMAYESGAPDGFTGAPGEGTCMTCHSNGPDDGQMQILAPPTYLSQQTYTITVELSDPDQFQWGFELTALDTAENKAGSFAITDAVNTQLSVNPPSIPDYVKQTTAGTYNGTADGPVSWSFEWTSPDTTTGPVVFYAAGNASQNTGSSGGFNYTAEASIIPGPEMVPAIGNGGLAVLIVSVVLAGALIMGRRRA
jgi:hypothetical protein